MNLQRSKQGRTFSGFERKMRLLMILVNGTELIANTDFLSTARTVQGYSDILYGVWDSNSSQNTTKTNTENKGVLFGILFTRIAYIKPNMKVDDCARFD